MELPFPPLPEQTAIAAHLEQELAKFDTLTTFISAAVTGQIDVRQP